MVCSYSPNPTISSQLCTNYPQNDASPYALSCTMPSDENSAEDTIYCRVYDGIDYSTSKTTTSTDENYDDRYYTREEIDLMISTLGGSDLTDLETRMTAAETDIIGLQSQIDDAEDEIADLETAMGLANADIADLQLRMTAAETAIAALETRMTAAETAISLMQDDIILINADIADLQDSVETLFGDVTELQDAVTSLQDRMTNVEDRTTSLEGRMSTAENDIDALESRMTVVEDQLVAMNHGTINLRYRLSANILDVWGEAPYGATGANVEAKQIGGSATYTASTSISNSGNKNRYDFTQTNGNGLDVSAWDKASYNIKVTFTGMSDAYRVGDIFTNLELEGIQSSLSVLYNEDEDLWIAVDDNTNQIDLIWDEVNDLWTDSSSQLNEINNLWTDSNNLWAQVDQLWMDSSNQWNSIYALEDRVTALENKLNAMNHGTINLRYNNGDANNNPRTLRVWGEAPYGAAKAEVLLKLADGTTIVDSEQFSTVTLGDNQKSYEFLEITKNHTNILLI